MTEFTPCLPDSFIHTQLFLDAVNSFNQHHWYDAHDKFEALWHQNTGETREFLHGMIQVAVAEYHLESGNRKGSVLLMAEGLNHLEHSKTIEIGYDLDLLREVVRNRLLALQCQSNLFNLPKPSLRTLRNDLNLSSFVQIPSA